MIVKVLLASNDDDLARVIDMSLRGGSFETARVRNKRDLMDRARAFLPELLIMDSAVSGDGTGLDICKSMESDTATAHIPIVTIIPERQVDDRIALLDAGVEDCVSRSVDPRELAARVRVVLRRTSTRVISSRLRAGPIDMDLDRWTVKVRGEPVNLTKKEFQLLETLLEAKGRTMSRELLLQHAWSYTSSHALDTRTVDVHIGRLRRKLGPAGEYIITVRNVGFRFDILTDWIAGYFR